MGVFNPIHRKLGCVGLNSDNKNDKYIQCLFTPRSNDPRYFNIDGFEMKGLKGVPGSNCAKGYANNDGLCAMIGSFTTEKLTTKSTPLPSHSVTPGKPSSSEGKDNNSDDVTVENSASSVATIMIGALFFIILFHF